MWYFDAAFWKMTGGFLLVIFFGIVGMYLIDTRYGSDLGRLEMEQLAEQRPHDEVRALGPVKEYVSYDLGLKFQFMTTIPGERGSYIKRQENRIYVCPVGDLCERAGQYVEILAINPNLDPLQAIVESVVPDALRLACVVGEITPTTGYPAGYRMFEIASAPKARGQCPEPYAARGGGYFLVSQSRPEQAAFFWVGQEAIFGTPERVPWQLTFRFID